VATFRRMSYLGAARSGKASAGQPRQIRKEATVT
jgi:hypothetical protein